VTSLDLTNIGVVEINGEIINKPFTVTIDIPNEFWELIRHHPPLLFDDEKEDVGYMDQSAKRLQKLALGE
jgi:hypothetical protein